MAPSESSGTFVPIVPNPFITGNPVRDPNIFFGREEDFAFARQRLVAEREGVVLLFVGERRSGKTSIMFQILNGRLGDEFLPVFIDMQAMAGVVGDREFFSRLAGFTCEQIEKSNIDAVKYDFSDGNPVAVADMMLDDIQVAFPDHRLVFLVDEAELLYTKVDSGELTGNVLVYMASILERRRISFCFTGSKGLGESQNDEWRRLIGKATYREISFLSHDDALGLIKRPVEGRVDYGEDVVEAIYRLTSGQPYYTQVICTQAVDHLNSVQRNRLEMDDLDDIIQTIIDNPPPSMIYTWDELSPPEQMTLSLMSEEG
jgi:hypothetical protein